MIGGLAIPGDGYSLTKGLQPPVTGEASLFGSLMRADLCWDHVIQGTTSFFGPLSVLGFQGTALAWVSSHLSDTPL